MAEPLEFGRKLSNAGFAHGELTYQQYFKRSGIDDHKDRLRKASKHKPDGLVNLFSELSLGVAHFLIRMYPLLPGYVLGQVEQGMLVERLDRTPGSCGDTLVCHLDSVRKFSECVEEDSRKGTTEEAISELVNAARREYQLWDDKTYTSSINLSDFAAEFVEQRLSSWKHTHMIGVAPEL